VPCCQLFNPIQVLYTAHGQNPSPSTLFRPPGQHHSTARFRVSACSRTEPPSLLCRVNSGSRFTCSTRPRSCCNAFSAVVRVTRLAAVAEERVCPAWVILHVPVAGGLDQSFRFQSLNRVNPAEATNSGPHCSRRADAGVSCAPEAPGTARSSLSHRCPFCFSIDRCDQFDDGRPTTPTATRGCNLVDGARSPLPVTGTYQELSPNAVSGQLRLQ
jgi:hypothetical protein